MLQPSERLLYARQLLLTDIGEPGQAQLCATHVHCESGDARACEVASEYLSRAGMSVVAANDARAGLDVRVADAAAVAALAGDERLIEAARYLAGSFAAVEAIKHALQVGTEKRLDATFTLASEAD